MTPEEKPRLIVLGEEDSETGRADGYPLLDLHRILIDHETKIELAFEPQGYKIVMMVPKNATIQEIKDRFRDLLAETQAHNDEAAELLRRRKEGPALTDEEQSWLEEFNSKTLPYSLELLRACIVDPAMNDKEFILWIGTLEKEQQEQLFVKSGRLIWNSSAQEEVTRLKKA